MPTLYYYILLITTLLRTEAIALGDPANWPTESPQWDREFDAIFFNSTVPSTPNLTLAQLITSSATFPIKFPIASVRASTLAATIATPKLEEKINSVYPVVHETALNLVVTMLKHKKRFAGNDPISKLSLIAFIDRLLTKRAIVFNGANDSYELRDGTKGQGSWETIGTINETCPLVKANYLSYEELKLAALLGVSSESYFIGKGEPEGVIIGVVGARLEKPLVMEYNEVVKSRAQNHQGHGYGNFFVPTYEGTFLNFYMEPALTYDDLERSGTFKDTERFTKIGDDEYFDALMYERRLALVVDVVLVEANRRAKRAGKRAFLHVDGLGLCKWKRTPKALKIFMDTFGRRIEVLGKSLGEIGVLSFSGIGSSAVLGYKDGDRIPTASGGIRVRIGARGAFDKLTGGDEGQLLVVTYNWNSNSAPGNTFWEGDLTNACDGAAKASASQIAELHNAGINGKVRAGNLHVVTLQGRVLPIKEYIETQGTSQ